MIVVDASATLAWAFGESDFADRFAKSFLTELLIAPPIWRLEVVNVVLRQERQHLITPEQGNRIFDALNDVGIRIVESQSEQRLEKLAEFARPFQLTAYDAVYLDLAVSAQVALLTLDKNLKDAANRLAVTLVEV